MRHLLQDTIERMVIRQDNYIRHSIWAVALGHNRGDGCQTGQLCLTKQMGGLNLDTVYETFALGHNREDGYQTGQLHQTQYTGSCFRTQQRGWLLDRTITLDTVDGTIALGHNREECLLDRTITLDTVDGRVKFGHSRWDNWFRT